MDRASSAQLVSEEISPPGLRIIRPQLGPQEVFLATPADVAVFGGAAFSGKTYALLLETLRHSGLAQFSATIFRRTTPQITNPGGLWDEAMALYTQFNTKPLRQSLTHEFPSGARTKFAHLEYDDTVYDWDGSQLPLIGYDQLEHFSYKQFFYMLSRNRDPSGSVRPYIRGTCNPDPDSWLAEFISWWINQETGYPIPEHAGVVRWFARHSSPGAGDVILWADTPGELHKKLGADCDPKSFTFVPGTIYDNVIGMEKDPGYLGNLKAMSYVERERLLGGNWKVRPAAGLLFRREWCPSLPAEPTNLDSAVRYWDLAATQKMEGNDPAWTVGVKLGRYARRLHGEKQRYVILDVRRGQVSPSKVKDMILNTAHSDGRGVRIGLPQDPGQAGKAQAADMVAMLAGYDVRTLIETGDKPTRFNPFSAQAEVGNVDYVIGPWNSSYLASLEGFPDGKVMDDADATSGAFQTLINFGGPIDLSQQSDEEDDSVTSASDSPWAMRSRR